MGTIRRYLSAGKATINKSNKNVQNRMLEIMWGVWNSYTLLVGGYINTVNSHNHMGKLLGNIY